MKKLILSSICLIMIGSCSSSDEMMTSADAEEQNIETSTIEVTQLLEKPAGIDFRNFDKTARPQDDFYRYVNGLWLDNTKIPTNRSNYGSFHVLIDHSQKQMREIIESASRDENKIDGSNNQKIGDLFTSYMDEERVEKLALSPLKTELELIDRLENKDHLASHFARFAMIGVAVPIEIVVVQDRKNTTQYITTIDQNGLGLPDRDYYFDETRAEIRTEYLDYIENLLSLAKIKNAKQVADNIMALETSLASHNWTRVQRRDANATYNKMSKAEFSSIMPAFNVDNYLLTGKISATEFIINAPSYFEGFNIIYSETELSIWKDYLRYKLLSAFASRLNKSMQQTNFDFYSTTLSGIEEMRPRWKSGISLVNNSLGFMLGKVYVEKHFPAEAKNRMVALVNNLTTAFDYSITDLSWMSEETKLKAKEKLSHFNKKIGYPDKWQDYSALTIKADDLVGNIIRSNEFNYNRNISRLDLPVDRSEWFLTPQTVNAYYNPPMNEIVIPAAILQPPFFNLEADDAVNYGAIGAVIGHEYGHGFDDQGRKYDPSGNFSDWWTEADAAQFKTRSDMLVKQYEQFQVFDDAHVNGHLTLGENIGDLGGLTVAYKAYKISLNGKESPIIDGFTGEQRFFMGWSQVWRRIYRDEALKRLLTIAPHSPDRYRVIGVLSNMPEFYEAFDVKPGDKMYLAEEERVKIW